MDFCLLNERSIKNKALVLKNYAVEHDLDIFALTETWLQPGDRDNYTIAELCPTGYFFHHVPREDSQGGGVGLLLKKRIQIKRLVKCSNGYTKLVTIYRPPPSRKNGLNNKTFFD